MAFVVACGVHAGVWWGLGQSAPTSTSSLQQDQHAFQLVMLPAPQLLPELPTAQALEPQTLPPLIEPTAPEAPVHAPEPPQETALAEAEPELPQETAWAEAIPTAVIKSEPSILPTPQLSQEAPTAPPHPRVVPTPKRRPTPKQVAKPRTQPLQPAVRPPVEPKPTIQQPITAGTYSSPSVPKQPIQAQRTLKGQPAVKRYTPPQYGHNPLPPYPRKARKRGVQGTVLLTVEVLKNGAVKTITITQSSGSRLLDRAARRAVKRWHFTPAQRGDRVEAATVRVPIRFQLK
ncbi:energy transducer TonB [Magnetococcus sp. PR-3]|uniref:energy transducer TonB n=1 Tax=Magnetococcus sp. PR-3 TaxID=3120355 RepID=UPI002FCDFD32